MTPTPGRNRLTGAGAFFAIGLVVAAASKSGGGSWRAVAALVLFYAAGAGAIAIWSRRSDSDLAALLGGTGDERQRSIDLRATALAGLAMGAFCLGMALVALARQDDNPWLLVCVVGAATYTGALLYQRARG